MTPNEYLQNPYGKGSAFSANEKQREELDKQYEFLKTKIQYKIYLYRKHAIYHVIVPSKDESRNVTYDVLFEFNLNDVKAEAISIMDTNFMAFSNCPSFVFTYANIFKSKKILCNWLIAKYNKEVRNQPPSTRNQYGIIGMERSLYLALKHIRATNICRTDIIQTTARKVNSYSQIAQYVRTQQDVMSSYKDSKLKVEKGTTRTGDSQGYKKKAVSKKRVTQFTKSVDTGFLTSQTSGTKKVSKTSTVKKSKKI